MTGFARVRKEIPQGELVLSLKSVNHRGLDLHFHLPNELDALENDIRAIPGVVGTGLFLGMADTVLVGDRNDFRMLEERQRGNNRHQPAV